MTPALAPIQPLPLAPQHLGKVWGGRALARHGRSLPEGPVGESFEASDLPGAESRVASGPLAGRTLAEVGTSWGHDALLGRCERLPFLVKVLDVEGPLSVQIHPGEERSRALGLPCAKSEGWVVLEARDGAKVGLGVRPGVTRDDLQALCLAGRPAEGLVGHAPRAGEVYYLPCGTVHYAGGGLLLYEFQRPADVTLRLHDWGRTRPDGSGVALQTALDAAFEGGGPALPGGSPVFLPAGGTWQGGGFRIRRIAAGGGEDVRLDTEGYVAALTVTSGTLQLCGTWGAIAVSGLGTSLLPARLGGLTIRGDGSAILCEVTS